MVKKLIKVVGLFVENEFQEMVVKQGLIPLEMVGAREGLKRPRSPDSAIKSEQLHL